MVEKVFRVAESGMEVMIDMTVVVGRMEVVVLMGMMVVVDEEVGVTSVEKIVISQGM